MNKNLKPDTKQGSIFVESYILYNVKKSVYVPKMSDLKMPGTRKVCRIQFRFDNGTLI